jgi:hypothetical protein
LHSEHFDNKPLTTTTKTGGIYEATIKLKSYLELFKNSVDI